MISNLSQLLLFEPLKVLKQVDDSIAVSNLLTLANVGVQMQLSYVDVKPKR